MSYPKLSKLPGAEVGGGTKFSTGVPYIMVSKYGSPRSNGPDTKRTSWSQRYTQKNRRRAIRLCKQ